MEPIPQTAEALRELAQHGEIALGVELFALSRRVRDVVPDLVGLSLSVIDERVTLTMVASTEQLAALDAVQYLDGGPCVASAEEGERLETAIADLLDEERWLLYAQASAAVGVRSSLSLPVMKEDRVIGGVNLYGPHEDTFTGRHEAIAEAVGSDAELAVANADLSFLTRKLGMEAPERVREAGDINIALGIISASQRVSIPVARERLRNAAARAGITEAQAARAIRNIRSA